MAAKRQLLLELLARDSTGPATKGAADNLDKVAVSAEEAAKATDNLGEQAGQSKEEVERFGKSNKTAAEHAEVLKHEIAATERELHQLAIAFAEAETAADRADFSKAIRKTQSDLRKLNKGKSLVEELLPDPEPQVKSFTQKISEGLSKIGPGDNPAVAIGIASLAPFIGAAISGAVIGAAGIGGIAGGLLIASKDPKVHSALDALKKETGDRLKDAAAPFVPVALDGIHEIDQALQGINFKGVFADAAKFSGPFIDGIAHLISSLGSGITDLIHNAGPAVAAIGDGIGEIGNAIGDGLSELSKDGQQGADALRDLFAVIDGGTRLVFGLIDGLTRVYGAAERINSLTGGGILSNIEKWQDYHQTVSGAAQATVAAAQAAVNGAGANKKLSDSAKVAADAARGQKDALLGVADAIRAQTDPVFAVVNAQKDLTTATDAYNAAVKKHGANSAEAKVADQQLALAALDLEGNVGKLGNSFSGKLTPQMIASFKAAHLTDAQIAGIAKQFATAKQKADAFAKKYQASVTMSGVPKAQADIHALQAKLNAMKGRTLPINVRVRVTQQGEVLYGNEAPQRADGGPVKKGHAYVVGERRPELFVPDRDGTIIPSVDRLGGSAAARPAGGGDVSRLVIDFANADGAMATAMIRLFRTNPGFRTTVAKLLGV